MTNPRVPSERLRKLLATIEDYTQHGRQPALTIDAPFAKAMAEDLLDLRNQAGEMALALINARTRLRKVRDTADEAVTYHDQDLRRLVIAELLND